MNRKDMTYVHSAKYLAQIVEIGSGQQALMLFRPMGARWTLTEPDGADESAINDAMAGAAMGELYALVEDN